MSSLLLPATVAAIVSLCLGVQAGRQAAACTAWTVFSLVSSNHSADTVKTPPVNIMLANAQMHCHIHAACTHSCTSTAESFTMSVCHLDFGLGKSDKLWLFDPSSVCEGYRETVI